MKTQRKAVSLGDHYTLAGASARFEAWWECRVIDRPPVTFWVDSPNPPPAPRANHASLRDRWFDVEFQVESAFANITSRPWLGDSVPSWMPNLGPDLTSTLFGGELTFSEYTSWCQRNVPETGDWERFIATPPDFDNVYWKTIDAMITRGAERFGDRCVVAMPDLHGSFDILAGLRGPENLCLDIMDEPELVRRAGLHAAGAYAEAFRRFHRRLTELRQPTTTWCSYLHSGPAYIPSCDFWCLVSRDIGNDLVRPTIEIEMAQMERSIFHLDGTQALQHLNDVLRLPGLNALQWVFQAGQGPASRWLAVYRTALEAGKAVQVLADDPEDALTVLQRLGPKGLWITVCRPFRNEADGLSFLEAVRRLSC